MKISLYTGGMASTNAYVVETNEGWLAIDAPEGFLDFLKKRDIKPAMLVLTHGHWDHIWDAAAIVREFSCPAFFHQDDEFLCSDSEQLRKWNIPHKLEPLAAQRYLAEGDTFEMDPWRFEILHIPGHCPGSICLYEKGANLLFGGDVLFAGGIGRTDLPGGSTELLLKGIRTKLFTLPDDTTVFPGHGPSTKIGEEKLTNPFLG